MLAPFYKPDKIQDSYDAIVIGSGIGGLCAAVLLGQAGKKVLVLERHYMPGGFTHTFSRKGYEWDVGLHYVGEVGRKNSVLSRIFRHITEGQLRWAAMPAVYDKICIADRTYDYEAPQAKLRANLEGYFPKERDAIAKYFEAVQQVNRDTKNFFMEKAMPPQVGALLSPFLRRKFLAYADRSTDAVIRQWTSDQELIDVLTGQYGDYGLPPKRSSFAVHAIVTRHYFDGGYYPEGGSASIFKTIAPVLEKTGGQIFTKAEVREILLKGKRVEGVRLADGNEIRAPLVISNAGFENTFARLLPKSAELPAAMHAILNRIKPSGGHLCVYAGIRQSPEQLGVSPSNYWIYPGNDHDKSLANFAANPEAPLPVTYLSFPAAKDPAWSEHHPGRSTFEAITFAPYQWFSEWEKSEWNQRGESYQAFKEGFARRLLEQVYRWVPQVKDKVDYFEISTPLSTRHFSNYAHGEIYGLEHTPERFPYRMLRPHTPFKGLFLTGQDVVTVGIGGALMGGVITASAVLRKNLIKEIMAR